MTRYRNLLFVVLFAAAACNDIEFDRVTLDSLDSPDDDIHVDDDLIRLPVGIAVEIRADIEFKGDYYYFGDYYHLEAEDSFILGVAPMAGSDTYLIWGASAGETCLEVNVAGTVEECIDVVVEGRPSENDTETDGADTGTGEDDAPPGCRGALAFPDASLEAVLREEAGVPTGDLRYGDLSEITALAARRSGISDLTGIQCLTRLRSLDLSDNTLRDLSPLSDLTLLRELRLSDNGLDDDTLLALTPLTGLSILDLSENRLGDLSSLSGLIGLTELDLSDNDIADLSPLAGLTSLSYLSLYNNSVEDLAPLVENPGIGSGDTVSLTFNALDCGDDATLDHLAALEERGVVLSHDCETPQ